MSHDMFSEQTIKQIEQIKKLTDIGLKIGFTCSAFDLLHPGHVLMLDDSKSQCDYLVVGLQKNPTFDRPLKNKPVQTYKERKIMTRAINAVDEIIEYNTEQDLLQILKLLKPDVRILGSDWKGKKFTGHRLPIEIHWHLRSHNYSTTKLRLRIVEAENKKRKKTFLP